MKDGDVFVFLDQILEATRLATSYVEGMTESDFLADSRTQQAVAMNLIIIGEAATRLGRSHPSFAAEHGELPWRAMIDMRNHIALGYVELDFRVIWRTTQTDLPELLTPLEAIYEAAGERIGGASKEPT
jgi:uncharacterized protein with HEPN domain